MKKLKMRYAITFMLLVATFVGIGILFVLSTKTNKKLLRESTINNMETYLTGQSETIRTFVNEKENILKLFGQSNFVTDILKDQENEKAVAAAQDYTMQWFNYLGTWEGIYIGNWDSKCLTYHVDAIIGKTFREGERLEQLRKAMLESENKIYNAGIIVSPGTGKLCLSMYAPVYDADGKTPLGYVGGGVFSEELEEALNKMNLSGLDEYDFYMVNTETKINLINKDEEVLALETEDPLLLSVIDEINQNPDVVTANMDKDGKMIEYVNMPDRSWALILVANESDVFSVANKNTYTMLFFCILAYIVIVALAYVTVTYYTKPLDYIKNAIVKLTSLDLGADETIQKYVKNENEVGILANGIEQLRETLLSIVGRLSECSDQVSSSSQQIMGGTERLSGYMMDNMATTEQLAASLSSTTEIVNELFNKIKNTNDKLSNIQELMTDSDEKSKNLLKSSQDIEITSKESLESSIESVNKNRQDILSAMDKLQELSSISELVEDIMGVAAQTNLLSLNASIEAARAGEAGKGFAVVASEIGKLAMNSSETASRINSICRNTDNNIKDVSDCFNVVVDYLETDISKKFETFNQIAKDNNNNVTVLNEIISEIRVTLNELMEFMAEVSEQMKYISSASEQNSAGVDDIVQKTCETTTVSEEMSKIATGNTESASTLNSVVRQFTNFN